MSEEEREIMARHAAHWQPWVESGQMVILGPVFDASGSWGLGVLIRRNTTLDPDQSGRPGISASHPGGGGMVAA